MNLEHYQNHEFDRGAGRLKELLWLLVSAAAFRNSVMPWYRLRRSLLRAFGARVAPGVIVKPGARVTFPWKFTIGAHSWIGEEAWILNLDQVTIGAHVCISQRAFLCTGNHDWSDPRFKLMTRPIVIGDGAWVCAGVFVGPGVTIGERTVVTAGSVVSSDLPAGMICSGNPCVPVKPRRMHEVGSPSA